MNVNDRHNRIPLFGVSLCSKYWEVFGLKKERVRERETHKREVGVPVREAHENRLPPQSNNLAATA